MNPNLIQTRLAEISFIEIELFEKMEQLKRMKKRNPAYKALDAEVSQLQHKYSTTNLYPKHN